MSIRIQFQIEVLEINYTYIFHHVGTLRPVHIFCTISSFWGKMINIDLSVDEVER
jgi:hypothetical protein